MKNLAAFIMRGWPQAVTVTVFTALSVMMLQFLLPAAWVSGAAIALVVLRQGLGPALQVLVASCVVFGVLLALLFGDYWSGVVTWAIYWSAMIFAGWLLRETASLSRAIQSLVAVTVSGVVFFYMLVGDPTAWWRAQFDVLFTALAIGQNKETAAAIVDVHSTLSAFSEGMTGAVTVSVLAAFIISLLLARFWQAQLYNPEGFRNEFYELRFGNNWSLLTVAAVLTSWVTGAPLAMDVAGLILVIYALQGIAVIHAGVAAKGLPSSWLGLIYVPLFLLFTFAVKLLALIGLVDTWMDIRKRFKTDAE